MNKRFFASFFLLFALLSNFGWHSTLAKSGGEKYFKETRHWVTGEFLTHYQSVSDPLKIYGYPITPAFRDYKSNLFIQYFQKARFELHPEAPQGQRILLTPLGEYLHNQGNPASIGTSSATCRTFQNGFDVCYAFLEFYEKYRGEALFGQPISNMEDHNGMIVQHFTNARFEWHPEYPAGQRVALADLGAEYLYTIREDPQITGPETDENTIQGILNLKVRAFPVRAVTSLDGDQTVYVVVQDQTLLPVANAQISVVVQMPSGDKDLYIVRQLTDKNGITKFTFPFSSETVGVVQVTVKASRDNMEAKNSTSFRLWW